MQPADDVVEELTRTVFETVLGREATRDSAPPELPDVYAVDIRGGWCGTIRFEVGAFLAARLAEAMLEMPVEAADDIRDAMCELANVIGGNLKGYLPGPSVLSIPRLADDGALSPSARRHLFACDGEPFSVTVCPSQPERNEP